MWYSINTEEELLNFMKKMHSFHDACINEMKYTSGAYVDDNLSMHPINDKRLLRVIVQQQSAEFRMIELEFVGLKYLKLFPIPTEYTCEIESSAFFWKNGEIYWHEHAYTVNSSEDVADGLILCASALRWRQRRKTR